MRVKKKKKKKQEEEEEGARPIPRGGEGEGEMCVYYFGFVFLIEFVPNLHVDTWPRLWLPGEHHSSHRRKGSADDHDSNVNEA